MNALEILGSSNLTSLIEAPPEKSVLNHVLIAVYNKSSQLRRFKKTTLELEHSRIEHSKFIGEGLMSNSSKDILF
jgi:hypothetical protein